MIQIGQCYATGEYKQEPEFKRHFRQSTEKAVKAVKALPKPHALTSLCRWNLDGKITASQMLDIRKVVCLICGTCEADFLMESKLPTPLEARCIYVQLIDQVAPMIKPDNVAVYINRFPATIYNQLKQFPRKAKRLAFEDKYNKCAVAIQDIQKREL